MCISLKDNRAKFNSDSIWDDVALIKFFEERRPKKNNNHNNNNNNNNNIKWVVQRVSDIPELISINRAAAGTDHSS